MAPAPTVAATTVLEVLSAVDTTVQGKTIDLSNTYTTDFVSKASSS
jgi:hypothetical protein